LLKARNVVVRGNQIGRSTLSAIKLGAELSWHEAGPVEHVVIEDNDIRGAGTDNGYRATGVMVTTESPQTPSHVNHDILIRNNYIEGSHSTAILLHDAQDVEIYGNTFAGGHEIVQKNCRDIRLGSNLYK
jgi:polygalacturonase